MKTLSAFARSIRHAGLVTMIAAASVVQACSKDTTPTGPASDAGAFVPDTRALAQGSTQLRVSGTVTDDEGVPVAGVRVTAYRWTASDRGRSTVTDDRGFYSLAFDSAPGIAAWTEKDGYESKWHTRNISLPADFQFDLRIHRIKQ